MFANTYFLLLESDLLGWLADNHDPDGWEETARSWLIAAIVIAVVCAGLMMFYKLLKKHSAENINSRIWSRGQTVLLMLMGLIPVLLLMCVLWYSIRDYYDVVRLGGLFKGIVFGWLLYLLFMFIGHLASPWRREIL